MNEIKIRIMLSCKRKRMYKMKIIWRPMKLTTMSTTCMRWPVA